MSIRKKIQRIVEFTNKAFAAIYRIYRSGKNFVHSGKKLINSQDCFI